MSNRGYQPKPFPPGSPKPIPPSTGSGAMKPSPPMGCICPPTSEKTCQGPLCPRKPISHTGMR